MSDGISGHGTTLSGESVGTIAQITRIGLPGMDVDDLDVTTMDSEEAWREFKAGLKDAGELELDLLYEKSNFATMLGVLGGANDTYTIAFPDSATFECGGYLKSLGLEAPQDDKVADTASFKLSGKPTFSAASG